MRLPASLPSCLTSAALLAALLAPWAASSQPLSEGRWAARARGVPVKLSLLPADAVDSTNVESTPIPVEPQRRRNAPQIEPPRRGTNSAHLLEEVPVTPGAWAVYGTFALVPVGGVYGASLVGRERLWVTASETVVGSVVGSVPGSLLFLQPAEAGGRWTELEVAGFGAGLVLTPPIAALGTWGLGELAFQGSQDRGHAFLGALGGAAAGTLLGVIVHGLLEEVVGNRETLRWFRKTIALGFVGSGATVGYQWAGGGPRGRSR